MPFNPFTWNTAEPSPTQLISNGQVTILNNFGFLGSTTGVTAFGFLQMPNGLILQWGKTGAYTDGATTLTFAGMGMQSFPTNCFGVFLQVRSSGTAHLPPNVSSSGFSNTGFDIFVTTGNGSNAGAYVFAIGN